MSGLPHRRKPGFTLVVRQRDLPALTRWVPSFQKQIDALKNAELAMTPRDFRDAGDVNLRVRGEVTQLGPKVPRNFLSVLHRGAAPKISAGSSGP